MVRSRRRCRAVLSSHGRRAPAAARAAPPSARRCELTPPNAAARPARAPNCTIVDQPARSRSRACRAHGDDHAGPARTSTCRSRAYHGVRRVHVPGHGRWTASCPNAARPSRCSSTRAPSCAVGTRRRVAAEPATLAHRGPRRATTSTVTCSTIYVGDPAHGDASRSRRTARWSTRPTPRLRRARLVHVTTPPRTTFGARRPTTGTHDASRSSPPIVRAPSPTGIRPPPRSPRSGRDRAGDHAQEREHEAGRRDRADHATRTPSATLDARRSTRRPRAEAQA